MSLISLPKDILIVLIDQMPTADVVSLLLSCKTTINLLIVDPDTQMFPYIRVGKETPDKKRLIMFIVHAVNSWPTKYYTLPTVGYDGSSVNILCPNGAQTPRYVVISQNRIIMALLRRPGWVNGDF